jgi:membrane-bound lytic murein transglycosylase F
MRVLRVVALALLIADAPMAQPPASASSGVSAPSAGRARQTRRVTSRYDETFRRYSKRYFGAAFDWRWFKAQGLAESNLDSTATSYVGARGIMQLMPATYQAIRSRQSGFGAIDDPEWNIAAGIMHDRHLWRLWERQGIDEDRFAFMFGSYNAGEGTIGRAVRMAREVTNGMPRWDEIEGIAPTVPRWRYRETLGYVRKIREHHAELGARGR